MRPSDWGGKYFGVKRNVRQKLRKQNTEMITFQFIIVKQILKFRLNEHFDENFIDKLYV